MIFGLRDRYSNTVERIEEKTSHHRKEASTAIDDLNSVLKELTTTNRNQINGDKNNP